jgi:hypothetical protein
MSALEITIIIMFFTILFGSLIYIFFKNKKCNKLNIFGKKPTNDNYQNWDGSNHDMPIITI